MNKALIILSELTDRDIDWVVNYGHQENVSASTVLIYENQPIAALYILLKGTLSVSVAAAGNQEVGRIGEGEVLGEMSFIDGRLPSATVTAIEDSYVLSIPRQKLAEKMEQDTLFSLRFYKAVTKLLSSRLRTTVNTFGKQNQPSSLPKDPAPAPASVVSTEIDLEMQRHRLNFILERLQKTL